MTLAEEEILLNIILFGISIGLAVFVIFLYRKAQPKFYGLLWWALFLVVCSAGTYVLYDGLLTLFLEHKSPDPNVIVVRKRLTQNVDVLAYVVPALLLAIAANLITSFMQAPTPTQRDRAT